MPSVSVGPPVRTTWIDELEEVAHELMNKPGFGAGVVTDVTEATTQIGEITGAATVVAGAEGPDELAVVLSGMAELLLLVLLFMLVITIRLIRWVEQIFVWVAGKIPFFGGNVQNGLRAIFAVIDPLENDVASAFAKLAIGMIDTTTSIFTNLMHWAGYQIFPPGSTAKPTTDQVSELQREISELHKHVNYLLHHAGTTNYVVSNPINQSGLPQNIWQDIHLIQADVSAMQRSMTEVQLRLDNQDRRLTSVEHGLHDLTHSIHQVRAIATGWQDIEETVGQLQTAVTTFVNTTTADLGDIHRRLTRLAPLTLLLTAGAVGLKTLRQLEDTPCMCPKIPSLPTLTPEWLAIYEFVTNG